MLRKDGKGFYNSSMAYPDLKCRCKNCVEWKSLDNKKWRKGEQPKKSKEYSKEYYQKNKEIILKKQNDRYLVNKESIRKYQSKYFKTSVGQEANRNGARRRRARKHNNGYIPYTEAQVLSIYGSDCYLCLKPINLLLPRQTGKPGWQGGLHIEHVLDIALGGPDTIENVRPAHAICNLTKNTNRNDTIGNGLICYNNDQEVTHGN